MKNKRITWPAILFAYTLMLPGQLFIDFGGFIIFPYRFIILIFIPIIISGYINRMLKANLADVIVAATMAWIITSLSMNVGLEKAISNGGASAIDIGGAYLLARWTLASFNHARAYLHAIAVPYLVVAITVLFETVSGGYVLQPLVARAMGLTLNDQIFSNVAERFGVIRGTGPFAHPILGGLQLASLLPIYLLADVKSVRRFMGTMASILSIATVSSAAVLTLAITGLLVMYEYLSSRLRFLTWRSLLVIAAAMLAGLQMFTRGGIVGIVVNYLSLDKWTASYRMLIWDYGTISVAMHPWFGIGFEEWVRPAWMPSSIDNYWLLIAMTYGVPEALLRLALPVTAAIVAGMRLTKFNLADRRIILGFTIAIAVMTLMAFTVAFWGVTQAWYYFLIGALVSLAYSNPENRSPGTKRGAE